MFTDNFDDNSIDTGRWSTAVNLGATVTETNQRIELQVASATSGSYAQIFGRGNENMVGSSSSVNLSQAPSGAVDTVFDVRIVDSSNRIMFLYGGGTLRARKTVAGVGSGDLATVSLTLGANTYLRLRESAGTTYWEYSTDYCRNWTTLWSEANPITLTSVFPFMEANEYASQASPSAALFDNLNLYPPPPVAWIRA